MAGLPARQIGRCLLRGRSARRPPFSAGYCPQCSPLIAFRHDRFSSTATTTTTPPQAAPIPLRKQLKDEAKARKAAKKKGGADAQASSRAQTVPGWELTVGIEIHAQLNTAHKLFSGALASDSLASEDSEPNASRHVAFFDVALPGAQPIFQAATLVPAIRAALALGCDIQPVSRFDRKHYFHWDQPAGYQITQYYEPFARGGSVTLHARDGIAPEDGESVAVDIVQVQMEQDTAKTVAQPGNIHWIDFNRVGMPLIEIITAPQLHHPATAAAFVRKVQQLLVAVDACTSGMEAGGLRADVNVSVRRSEAGTAEAQRLGVRTEIKNLNSFRAVEDAIIAERNRQIAAITAAEAAGHPSPRNAIESETRGWTPPMSSGDEGKTHRLRGKEGEIDYRYMPDPDLGPVVIDEGLVRYLGLTLGVSPDAELDDLVSQYGLSEKDAASLMSLDGGGRAQFFYDVVEGVEQRLAEQEVDLVGARAATANWVLHQLGKLTSERNAAIGEEATSLEMTPEGRCRIPVDCLADIVAYRYQGKITAGVAKELLYAVFRGDISDQEGSTVTDAIEGGSLWFDEISPAEYEQLAQEAMEGEEKTLKMFISPKKYPQGKLQFLVGKLLRLGPEGRTDPQNAEAAVKAAVERWVEEQKA